MNLPLVSIIIPVYKHGKTLETCLDSIFAQTYERLEVIVVDDGSNPPIELTQPRVLLIHEPHRGASAARNAGARHARGEFYLFIDCDVVLEPAMVAKMIAAAREHPDASFIYSGFTWGRRRLHPIGLDRFDVSKIRDHNFVSTMSLIRQPHFPGFDEALPRLQDWDLWLTMTDRGRTGWGIPEVLYHINTQGHITKGGISYLRSVKRLRSKHHLPPRRTDYVVAFKEALWSLLPF